MSSKTEKIGIKNDSADNKLRWDLLPLDMIEWLVKCFDYGAKKYAPNNWKLLDNGYERYKAAMLRHLAAYEKGECIDPESKLPHLAHMAWNALAVLYFGLKKDKEL